MAYPVPRFGSGIHNWAKDFHILKSLVFLVSGASHETLFALVLFDSPLSDSKVIHKTDAKEVSFKALYEAPLSRKTKIKSLSGLNATFKDIFSYI